MGNAFKRWLLPGYGSTILEVDCELKAPDGTTAATIHHQRSVFAGGVFTIGAWKTIFGSVASDIADELEARLKARGFAVNAPVWSARNVEVPRAARPLAIKVVPFADGRADKSRLGERFAAFNVSMGNVYLSRTVPGYLTETVTDDLLAAGHKVDESGQDVTLTGEVKKFSMGTETTMLYWDVVGEIELRLKAEPASDPAAARERSYITRQSRRTYAWPSGSLFEEVLNLCMEDLVGQVRADGIWNVGSR